MPKEITIIGYELFDEGTSEFFNPKTQKLKLEHSLVSLSKWESKWCKPFLKKEEKTREEMLDYIKCMTLTQNVDPNIYRCLSRKNLEEINAYINAPMTATTFSDKGTSRASRETTTSEIIYYQMIELDIPFECEKWHLNRLLTLIRVCSAKKSPKKMSKKDTINQYAALNAARKKQFNSKG